MALLGARVFCSELHVTLQSLTVLCGPRFRSDWFQIFSTVLMQILYLLSWIMLEVWFFQHQLSCTPFHPEWQLLQICSCRCSFVCFLSICFKSSWTNMIKRLVIICRIHIIFSKSPSRTLSEIMDYLKEFQAILPPSTFHFIINHHLPNLKIFYLVSI